MSLKSIATKVKKHLDNPKVVLPWLLAGSFSVGTPIMYNIEEAWDNNPTEKTAQVTAEFNKRVKSFRDLTDRYETLEKFGLVASSDTDKKVTIDNALIKDYLHLKKTLRYETNELFSDVILNPDLTEAGAEALIGKMSSKGLGQFVEGGVPKGGFYALKEIKASFNDIAGLDKQDMAEKIKIKMTEEAKGDTGRYFATFIGTPMGVYAMMWAVFLGAGTIANSTPSTSRKPKRPLKN